MRIYLDVSCLSRPFDDQTQSRIRIETEAIRSIFEKFDSGEWEHVASQISEIEIDANTDPERQRRIRLLLPESEAIHTLNEETFARSEELESFGFKPADALHIAAAEEVEADAFLSCDARLCRRAHRKRANIRVRISNPVDWLRDIDDAHDP